MSPVAARRTLAGIEIAGQLTERVQLSGVSLVDDGHGGQIETEVPLQPGEVFARIDSVQGSERFAALALEVAVLWIVYIRWHAAVTAGTRITWGAHVLEVNGPPVEIIRRQFFQLYCSERGTR